MNGLKKLTDCEALVMKIIWKSENVLALRDIVQQVNLKYNKSWKPQTVSTFLTKLVTRGFLEMERKGRQFFYYTLVSEEEYSKKEIADNIELWADGKVDVFMERYLQERKLTKEEKTMILSVLDSVK